MIIAELKQKLGVVLFSQAPWQIIEFGAKDVTVSPIEYSWINMYELKPEPHFNIFFHERDDGNICVEIHFAESFLFMASLPNRVNMVQWIWSNSTNFRADLDAEVTAIINIIFKIS